MNRLRFNLISGEAYRVRTRKGKQEKKQEKGTRKEQEKGTRKEQEKGTGYFFIVRPTARVVEALRAENS